MVVAEQVIVREILDNNASPLRVAREAVVWRGVPPELHHLLEGLVLGSPMPRSRFTAPPPEVAEIQGGWEEDSGQAVQLHWEIRRTELEIRDLPKDEGEIRDADGRLVVCFQRPGWRMALSELSIAVALLGLFSLYALIPNLRLELERGEPVSLALLASCASLFALSLYSLWGAYRSWFSDNATRIVNDEAQMAVWRARRLVAPNGELRVRVAATTSGAIEMHEQDGAEDVGAAAHSTRADAAES
ncbi:MAG: hypothetical protein KC492_04350 [Myxococcales bacterium]|nr:hypothetical protein [Myxococcales bacterium]